MPGAAEQGPCGKGLRKEIRHIFSQRLKKQKLMEEESGGHGSKEDGEERLEGAEQKAWGCQGKEHVYEAARKC